MVDHVMAYAISQAQEPYIRIDSTQGCVRHSVANLASCTMPVDMIGVPHMIGGLQRRARTAHFTTVSISITRRFFEPDSTPDKPRKATIMRLSNTYGVLLVLAAWMACCQAATRRDPRQCPRCPSGIPETAPPPGDFAFYFLVRQWPDEFCYKQQGCSTIPDPAAGFTLHGLWPNLDNACQKDYPEHCSYRDGFDAFDVSNIDQDTLTSMEQNWPSYTTANECFWEHEWDCHGSCSGLAQQKYFQGVLDLHSQYNIPAALSAANIEPSNQAVSTRDFEQALRDSFGVTPYLYCEHSGGQDYINEVFMCFTKDLRAVDCDQVCTVHPCEPRSSQDCGTELIYKLSNVRSKPQKPCTGSFRQCRPKSGTCAD